MGFWDENRWTRPYGYRPGPGEDNPYTLGFHIGQDVAGKDWFAPVPTLRTGRVEESGRSGKIGGYVVVQVGDEFDTYCHLNSANLPAAGTWLAAGTDIAPLARSTRPWAGADYMGSASDGAHCHFVRSRRRDTAYNPTLSAILDPRPIIRAATTGTTAADSARPFQTAPVEGDENMTKLIRWNGVHVFGVAREAIYHVPTVEEVGTLEALYGKVQDVDNAGLTAALRVNGIPWNGVDAALKGAAFESTGGYWSRLTAEGEAIRGNQAAAEKTIDDVLATVATLGTTQGISQAAS